MLRVALAGATLFFAYQGRSSQPRRYLSLVGVESEMLTRPGGEEADACTTYAEEAAG